jgi:uncharacterized protein YjbI with pentapeptide repeats
MRHRILAIAVTLVFGTGIGTASAFDQAHFEAVKDGKKDCPWCDLSGADFTGIEMSGVDLSGANLTDANLSKAAFTNVDLSGADLTGVNVEGTKFTDSNLKGADLDQVDLTASVLVRTKLETAYCDWATKLPESTGLACEGVAIQRKQGASTKHRTM